MNRHPFWRWHTPSFLSSLFIIWTSVTIHSLSWLFSSANECVCIFRFQQAHTRIHSLEPATTRLCCIFYTTFVDVRKSYGKMMRLFIGASNYELKRPGTMVRREIGIVVINNIRESNKQNECAKNAKQRGEVGMYEWLEWWSVDCASGAGDDGIQLHREIYRKYKSNITDKWSRIEFCKTNRNIRAEKAKRHIDCGKKKFCNKK